MENGEISKFSCPPSGHNSRPKFFCLLRLFCFLVCFLKVLFCLCLWILCCSIFKRNIQHIFFLSIIMGLMLSFIYIFIWLNSLNYSMKGLLSPIYTQRIVRLNTSLSTNILLPLRGKDKIGTGTFCHLLLLLWSSSFSILLQPIVQIISLLTALTCNSLLTPCYLFSSSKIHLDLVIFHSSSPWNLFICRCSSCHKYFYFSFISSLTFPMLEWCRT